MLRRLLSFIPVVLFIALVTALAWRLVLIDEGNTPNQIPSVMINRAAPDFTLPSLFVAKQNVTSKILKGKVTLVNVFASWCVPCRAEHPLLSVIKKSGIQIIGIDYKDKPEEARALLDNMGNPYDTIGADTNGRTAIDFGTYGVPESYLIDRQGVIRFKQAGPLTPDIIRDNLLPMIRGLQQ
jgi:DsbE subfamily thiol:disulfide oxidoreductase